MCIAYLINTLNTSIPNTIVVQQILGWKWCQINSWCFIRYNQISSQEIEKVLHIDIPVFGEYIIWLFTVL